MQKAYAQVTRLADLMQELAVADAALDAMDGVWAHLSDSTTAELDSLQSQVTEGIGSIHDMLWTPKDFVGYDHVTVRVMNQLYDAMPDLDEGATANAARKLEIATSAIDAVEEEVRALMDGPWQAMLSAARKVEVTVDGVLNGIQSQED